MHRLHLTLITVSTFICSLHASETYSKVEYQRHKAAFLEYEKAHPAEQVARELGLDRRLVEEAYAYCRCRSRARIPDTAECITRFAALRQRNRFRAREKAREYAQRHKKVLLIANQVHETTNTPEPAHTPLPQANIRIVDYIGEIRFVASAKPFYKNNFLNFSEEQ